MAALYVYLDVCHGGVIISMSKELNFQSRMWVMVVKHVYVQLSKPKETGKVNCIY